MNTKEHHLVLHIQTKALTFRKIASRTMKMVIIISTGIMKKAIL